MEVIVIEEDMDDFYYARRHLAKLSQANADGWHELRYEDEEVELMEAIEKTLRTILERDGEKYFKEVAANLFDTIASNVSLQAEIKREMRSVTA